jgi:hypothetical protein
MHIHTMSERSKRRMIAFILAATAAAFVVLLLIALGQSRLVVVGVAGFSLGLAILILLSFRR